MLYKQKGSELFPRLFEPGYIGGLKLKNRLIKAPTATNLATADGYVTERMIRHYTALARGGAGLIIVEFTYIDDKASKMANNQLGVSRDSHQTGLEWLASTIRINGASACLQICHAGHERDLPGAKTMCRVPWAPAQARGLPPPEELTFEEIIGIVDAFGDAAARAKTAGFDMVEIHGGHGYLITNSLSPAINRRTDWYGGNLTNRMRLLLEIIENMRRKVGPDFPISVRLSGTDYAKNDPITIEETKEVAKAIERAGINVIHVSGGTHSTSDKEVVRMYWPQAYNTWAADEIKKVVSIPVIASGAINTPYLAERILTERKSDFVAFGRPLLADPDFPQKARDGHPEDIRPCIRCCDGCLRRGADTVTACSVNPAVAKEEEYSIKPAVISKKIAVVGGGPAGMEAARVTALMGHEVTLFEKRKLGGRLLEAAVPDFKADIRLLIDYLSTQVKKTGVKIINQEATNKEIVEGKFDVAIVACGGIPLVPDIPGLNEPCVISDLDVLNGVKTGENVLVVGGGMIGSDVALYLAEQGKNVIITTRGTEIADDMERFSKVAFMEKLNKQKVTICTRLTLEHITNGIAIYSNSKGTKQEIKADNIVISAGILPDRKLFEQISTISELELYAIGDCVNPGMIYDAIHDGFMVAHLIH
jgi:2,4-dienoyl-CoA reductase-like NADH-dependent reductase (Old Yellow Enzyme family)/thioredoxin reductase